MRKDKLGGRSRAALSFGALMLLGLVGTVGVSACSAEGPKDEGTPTTDSESALRGQRLCDGPLGRKCAEGEYCSAAKVGRCPSARISGVCAEQPEICPKIFKPVCGCDGKTYSNGCEAASAGVAVESDGACTPPPTGPACGGLLGTPCEGNATCVDDPSDDCDPKNGGADCIGICVDSGSTTPTGPACGGFLGTPCEGDATCVDDPSDDCDPKNGGADCIGICVPKGPVPPTDPVGPACGGFAGIPCPGNATCVDNPADSCDPKNGGADCIGICRCEATTQKVCPPGSHFDPSPQICGCAADTNPCAAVTCQVGSTCVVIGGKGVCQPPGPKCGANTCSAGQICCSPSCGICGPRGGLCPQIVCGTTL